MNTKSTILSLIAVLSFLIPAHATEVDSVESLREVITTEILQDARDDVVGDLIRSGVSEVDAEQIFFVFVNDFVSCVFDAADEIAARRGLDLDSYLSDSNVDGIETLYDSDVEYRHLLEPCVDVALANAGLDW